MKSSINLIGECVFNHTIESAHFASTDNTPPELKALPQWVRWGYRVVDGRSTKVPFKLDGFQASSTNPKTWASYEKAAGAYLQSPDQFDGIGFVFDSEDPYTGIDLDNCCNPKTGLIDLWAWQLIRAFSSYTENSPSGTGVHIFIKGQLPDTGHNLKPIEMYSKGRYFTVTGRHLEGTPLTINNRQRVLDLLECAYPIIVKRIVRGDSEGFQKSFSGDMSGYLDSDGNLDESRADQALCDFCAHVGATYEQVDAVVRLSGLYREKWERQGYRDQTINNALKAAAANQPTSSTDFTGKGGQSGGRNWAPLSDPVLNEVVTALRQGEVTLSNTDVQGILRRAGEDPWARFDINQRLYGSGVDTRAMWGRLDAYEAYSEIISMGGAIHIAEEEYTERLVERMLPCRGFSILGAKPKVGKSTLVRNLIAGVVNGGEFLGRKVLQTGPVLYYVFEEEFSEVIGHLRDLGVRGDAPVMFRRGCMQPLTFRKILQEDIAKYQPKLIVADPLIRLLGLIDVNDYGAVNAAVMPLVDIVRQANAHFMVLHHTNKVSQDLSLDSFLGSTSFAGALDAALLMCRQGNARFLAFYKRYRKDIEIPKTQLVMDDVTGFVHVAEDQVGATPERDLAVEMAAVLEQLGRETTRKDLKSRVQVSSQKGTEAIRDAIARGLIHETPSGKIVAAQQAFRYDPTAM